jgi:hypothetical protein
VSNTAPNPFKLPDGKGIPLVVRLLIYAALGVPSLVILLFVYPQYMPIFSRLEQADTLPLVTSSIVAFLRFNAMGYYAPVFVIVVALLDLDVGLVVLCRNKQRWKFVPRIWFWAMVLFLALLFVVLVYGLLAPVFKMSSTVG